MSSFLPLVTLPLRPSTQTLLQQRGFITLGEWNEAKRAGLESLAAELQLDPSDAQGIWKEIQECVCAAGPESQQAQQAPRTTKAMTASDLLATSSSSSSSSSLSPLSPSPLGIVSFCRAIDQLFWTGGIPLGSLTEVAGLPGAGKTQLAMQLAVTARLPQFLGGVQGQTIYIDTEGSLVPERIYDMAQALLIHIQGTLNKRRHAHARPSSSSTTPTTPTPTTLPKDFDSPESILEKIHVFRVYDSAALLSTLYSLPHWIETLGTSTTTGTSRQDDPSHQQSSSLPIKLIIVDSIAFPFRSSSTPWQSAQSLTQLAGFLNDLASQYQLAVVCINHMTTTKRKGNKAPMQQGSNHPSKTTTTNEDGGGESSLSYIPALGDSWAHAVTTRLILEPLSLGPPNPLPVAQQQQQQPDRKSVV